MLGMVVGIGVFKAPALVAQGIDSSAVILLLWVVGAALVLVGALCYAELASAWPDAGGEYHFLARAFGPGTAFMFAWGRLAVVQTGAIAAVAFVLGDYAQGLLPLGPHGAALYAVTAIAGITALNISGTRLSAGFQDIMAVLLVAAILAAAALPLFVEAQPIPPVRGGQPEITFGAVGFAMIFVMLTYGGWNEAAYLSAELKDVRRNMVRVVVIATAIIAGLYLALNMAYLHVLGPAGMRGSETVGADYMRALLGAPGAGLLSLLVITGALTTLNATIFTGARSCYAMGRDMPLLEFLGRWNARAQGPVNAHLVQALLAIMLVAFGWATRQGFTAMVEYTAPVFWFFLLLIGVSLFVLRRRGLPDGAFRVPLYPLSPILFCASSAYMLHASVAYTGVGAVVGVAAVMAGLPLWYVARRRCVSGAA